MIQLMVVFKKQVLVCIEWDDLLKIWPVTTQNDIVDSARKQFLAHGFAGASISEIAKGGKGR